MKKILIQEIDYSDDEEERKAKMSQEQRLMKSKGDRINVQCNISENNTNRNPNKKPFNRNWQKKMPESVKRRGKVYRPAKPVEESQNPFYRGSRSYNRYQNGPIRWDSISGPCSVAKGQKEYYHNRSEPKTTEKNMERHIDRTGILENYPHTPFTSIPLSMVDFSRPPPGYPSIISQTSHRESFNERIPQTCISKPPVNYREESASESSMFTRKLPEQSHFGQIQFNNNLSAYSTDMGAKHPIHSTGYYPNPPNNFYGNDTFTSHNYNMPRQAHHNQSSESSRVQEISPPPIMHPKFPIGINNSTCHFPEVLSQSTRFQPPLPPPLIPHMPLRSQYEKPHIFAPPKVRTWEPCPTPPPQMLQQHTVGKESTSSDEFLTAPGT